MIYANTNTYINIKYHYIFIKCQYNIGLKDRTHCKYSVNRINY